jgi:hypothetical protein
MGKLTYIDIYDGTLHGGVTCKEYAGNLRINRDNPSKGLKPIQSGHLVVRYHNRYLGAVSALIPASPFSAV